MRIWHSIAVPALMAALFTFSGEDAHARQEAGTISQQLDSGTMARLTGKVEEYMAAIVAEPVEIQKMEADFLIETCTDSLVRQAVALKVYSHYLNSKIMGAEAVAVHICEKWFLPGKIKMHSDLDLLNARIFTQFNRSSLIGMKAPELCLQDMEGGKVRLFPSAEGVPENGTKDATGNGRYSILYFYSTDCPKCRVETILLRNILDNGNFPVDLYAIYTGSSQNDWTAYADKELAISAGATGVFNLWDPEMSSDFQVKYGILQTPGMFLVDPAGKIIGRRLDSVSLEKLLKSVLVPAEMQYGTEESAEFYDKVFEPYGDSLGCGDINAAADHISKTTLGRGDTLLFKQMAGDLLYYLSGKRDEPYKCGLEYLISNYIDGNPAWKGQDDSLKVLGFASIMMDLLSRAPVGSPVPDIKVPAVIMHMPPSGHMKVTEKEISLRKAGGRTNIIIFHTEGCPVCKSEIEAAGKILSKDIRAVLIDMDMIFSSCPELAQKLFDSFDLTSLPYITVTDRKGTVMSRYTTLVR